MNRKIDLLRANMRRVFDALKKTISLTVSIALIINLLGFQASVALAGGSFSGYNENLVSMSSSEWLTLGAEFNASTIVMRDEGAGTTGQAIYDIDVSAISSAISKEGLEINFSVASFMDSEAGYEEPLEDVCSAEIAFSTTDSADNAISKTTLERGSGSPGSALALTSGASIPKGTQHIVITLRSMQVGAVNSGRFSNVYLSIDDSQGPSISADYDSSWTNSDVEVTVTASDSDSGVEGIYDSSTYELKSSSETYVFTVTENSSYSFLAQDYAGYTSDDFSVDIANIDKNAPVASLDINLSTGSWTRIPVTFTLSEFTAASGESPEKRQYKLGEGDWTDYTGEVTVSAEGTTTIYARVADEAGNTSETTSSSAYVDSVAPYFAALTYTPSHSGGATVTATASDASSGVAQTLWAAGNVDIASFPDAGTAYTNTFNVANGGVYTVYASDNAGNQTVETITVNTYPTIENIGSKELDEDHELDVVFAVSDYETAAGDLSVSAASDDTGIIPDPVCVNNNGSVTLTIDPLADKSGGPITITVSVSDGDLIEQKTFEVTVNSVNDVPVANDDSGITVEEDSSVQIDVLANDSDTESGELSVASVGAAGKGTVTIAGDGKSVTYTPNANANGADSFTYVATDGQDTSNTATVSLTITEENDKPVAASDYLEILEDESPIIDVIANDTDSDLATTDDEVLTIVSVSAPDFGTAAIQDNKIKYVPPVNWSGVATFTYTIDDRQGEQSTAAVEVTVKSDNDKPSILGLLPEYVIDEDQAGYVINLELADVETPLENIMFQVSSGNQDILSNSKMVVSGLGDDNAAVSVTITPNANKHGTLVLTFKASDGFLVETQTATLIVNSVNDAPVAEDDELYYTEDSALQIDMDALISNDTDIDGDSLYFDGIDTYPSQGTLVESDAENNIWTFNPGANDTGNITFKYILSDSQAQSVGTVTLHASSVNDKPTIVLDEGNVYECNEDEDSLPLYFTVDDIETSPDYLILAVGSSNETIVSSDHIVVTHGEEGLCSLVITPNGDQNGTITISVTVSDGANFSTETFSFDVNAVQDAPVAVNDSYSVMEGSHISFDPLINDRDADGETISIDTYSQPSHGTLSLDGSVFTYTPNAGYVGTDSFTYDITDTHETAQATVSFTINDFSSVPQVEPIANQYIYEDNSTGNLSFTATDADADDILTVTAVSDNTDLVPNSGGNIVISDLGGGDYNINIIPADNKSGKAGITITAEDLAGNTDSITFYVYVFPVNDEPIAYDDTVVTDEDTMSDVIDMLANDIDAESDPSELTVISVTSPSHGRVTQDASFDYHYIPDPDYHGEDSFTYIMTDGESNSTATVYVTVNSVNDAPYAENDWITVPNNPGEVRVVSVLNHDYDGDGDTIYLHEIVSGPTYGTAVMNADNTVTYTRNSELPDGYEGADSFVYKIRDRENPDDPDALFDTARVYIDDIFYSSLNAYSISRRELEDCEPFYINLSIGNPTGNTLIIETSTPTLGTVSEIDNVNRRILFTPSLNANGSETISYTVTDGETTDTAYIYLTLIPVNDVPYFINTPESVIFDEDTTAGLVETTGIIEFTYDDYDAEHDIADLSFNIKATPNSGQSIAIVDADIVTTYTATGATITIMPLEDMNGTGILTVNVSDGLDKAEIEIPYTVSPVNDKPYAPDYTRTLPEDTSASIDLVNVISDIDGDIVTMTVEDGDGPTNGSVTVAGEIATYTPEADYFGNDNFVYTLNDSNGGVSTGTVYLIIENVNDPPVISGLYYYNSTLEDVEKDIVFTVSDNEGDTPSLSFNTSNSSIVPVDNISYAVNGEEVTITVLPAENKFGTVVITANIFDGTDTISRDFQLFIKSVNDDPIALNDSYEIQEDTPTVFSPTSNDTDVEDTNLEIFEISETLQGATVVNHGDGTITYTPPQDFYGTDTFTYIISDDHDSHTQATVTVDILSVNDAPDAVDDDAQTDEDIPVTIDVLENDSDVEDNTLTVVSVDSSSATLAQSITNNGDGTITYVPLENQSGTDTFTYTVSDGQSENSTSTANVTVVINAVNDEPVAAKSEGYTGAWEFYEDTIGVFGIDVTDVETASEYLLVTITSSNQQLIPDTSIELSGTFDHKIVSLTPKPNMFGTLVLTVEMSDGVNTSYGTFDVTVLEVNDRPTISQADVETDEDQQVNSRATARDVETPGDYLEFSHDTSAPGPLHGDVIVNIDGTWTYTPDENYNGPDSFTIMVDDMSDSDSRTNTVVANIMVHAQNDNPVADSETVQTAEDTPITIDVLTGDTDVDQDLDLNKDPEYNIANEILSIKEDGFSGLDHGTAQVSEGQVLYTPDLNWYGTETFTYTVIDPNGGQAQGTIEVQVTPVNDAPSLAVNNGMLLYEGTTKTVTNAMLNEGDPDDSGSAVIYKITAVTQNGLLQKNGVSLTIGGEFTQTDIDSGYIKYVHDGSETSNDSFGFTLSDGGEDGAEPASETFNITIIEVNDAPEITPISDKTIAEDGTTGPLSFTVTDIDSDNVQLQVAATSTNTGLAIPADNIVILDGDGTNRTVQITPITDKNGDTEITLTVSDVPEEGAVKGKTASTSFTLHVTAMDDAPDAQPDEYTVYENDGAKIIDVTANDDVDYIMEGDDLSIVSLDSHTPSVGTSEEVVDPGDGREKIQFTPDADWTSNTQVDVVISYTMQDSNGDTSSSQLTVHVMPENDAPVINQIADQIIEEDKPTDTLSLTVSDEEDDDATLTMEKSSSNKSLIADENIVLTHVSGGSYNLVITPEENQNGSADITISVTDADDETVEMTFKVTVSPINDAPYGGDDNRKIDEDTVTEFSNLLANDDIDEITNPDLENLTITSITQPLHGTAVLDGTSVTYTPDENYYGSDAAGDESYDDDYFTYSVEDIGGQTNTFIVYIEIEPVNDAPVITAAFGNQEINEGTPSNVLSFTVNDVDDDDATLTVTGVSSKPLLINNNDIDIQNTGGDTRTVQVTPNGKWNGVSIITLTVKDDDLAWDETESVYKFTVTVASVNEAPVANDDTYGSSYGIQEDVLAILDVLGNDTDGDLFTNPAEEKLTIKEVSLVNSEQCTVQIINEGTALSIKSAENWNGETSFQYTVQDAAGATDTATVTLAINQVNDNPEAGNDTGSAQEDNAATIDVLNNDTDKDQDTDLNHDSAYPPADEVLSVDPDGFSGVEHGTATVNGEGDVIFTPAADWHGVETFTYTVKDSRGGSATADVTVTISAVNDVPDAVNDSYTIDEDAQDAWTFTVLSNDTDADKTSGVDPTETMTLVSVAGVDAAVCTVDIVDGTQLRFNPIADWNGTTTFTYTIEDLSGATDTATVTVAINQVNDDPEAGNDTGSALEDNAATIDVLSNDTDKDQDTDLNHDPAYPPAEEVLSVDPDGFSGVEHGTATVNGEGDVVFTPAANWHGVETFTYTVKDSRGGSATADVTVTISAVNDLPDAVNDTYTINEDAQDAWTFTVLANDTDADLNSGVDPTETMTIVSVAGVDAAVCTVDIVDGTQLRFNPIANWNGTTTFTYTIEDLSGATDTATVTVSVNQVNDNPEAVNDTGSAQEDNAATIDVLSNDTDKDQDTDLNNDSAYPPAEEVLSVDPDGFSGVEHGTATVNGEGDVVFTPAADWHGVETFTYTVKDSRGGSATADVTVTITAVNDVPDTVNDSYTIDEDAQDAWTFTVLSNDTDADKTSGVDTEELTIVSLSGVDTAMCTVEIVDGTQLRFNPIADWNGTTTFTYTIEDLSGATDTSTVTVKVNQVNDNPEAGNDTGSAQEDNAATIDVLNNDTDRDQDTDLNHDSAYPPAEEVLSVDPDGFSGVEHGTATVNGEGDVVFTPAANWHGIETFTYTVKDSRGGSATADVTVTITAVNDAPLIKTNTGMTLYEGSSDTILKTMLDENDVDDSGDELQYNISRLPDHGTLYLDGVEIQSGGSFSQADIDSGKVTYTHDGSETISDSFDFTLNDGGEDGASGAAGIFNIKIEPVNDPPVTEKNTGLTLDEGAQSNITTSELDHSDVDNADSELVYEIGTNVSNGILYKNTQPIASGDKFTQQELAEGIISYKHDGGESKTDSFTFTLSDNDVSLELNTFNITVNGVNDEPIIVTNTGMSLNEGDTKAIGKDMLETSDPDNENAELVYEITKVTENGTVYLNDTPLGLNDTFTQDDINSGRVTYKHDGSETNYDEFGFTVNDQSSEGGESGVFAIEIKPANDPPVLVTNAGLTLDEGAQSDITTSELLHSDIDNSEYELVYEITADVSNGTLYKNDTKLSVGDTFTLKELMDGAISYKHDGGETATDKFTFVLSDNDVSLDATDFSIAINRVNDEPTMDTNTGMTLDEGATKAISNEMLETQDVDNDSDEIVYTVTKLTVNGTMYLNGTEIIINDTFTQDDINNGRVAYNHDGSETKEDEFGFTVNDQSSEGGSSGTFEININPVNDPPETPEVKTPTADKYYKDGQTIHVTWTKPLDPENDELTYKLEFFDGDTWSTLTEALGRLEYDHVLGTTGLHTEKAKYRVTANDGELSSDAGAGYAFIIDNKAPIDVAVSLKSLAGADIARDSWSTGAKITVSGGSDLLAISYFVKIDEADPVQVLAGEVTSITKNGEHTVVVTARDLLGNETVVGTYVFNIDNLAPLAPKVTFTPGSYTDGDVKVAFSFYDDPGGSGNNTIILPNSTSHPVSNSVTWTAVGNGTYKMTISDVAGNKTTFSVEIDWIDTSVPRISLNQNGYELGTWSNKNIIADLVFYDSASGIYNKDYYVGTSASASPSWSDYSSSVSFTQDGTYYLYGFAQDRAGNQAREVFGEFKIDKTAPIITITANDDGTFTIRCSDALSGLLSIVLDDGTEFRLTATQTWAPEFFGEYEIVATDKAGNSSTVTGTIEEPEEEPIDEGGEEDTTPPEVEEEQVQVNEQKKTAQVSIKASDTGSGVEMIILENGKVYYSQEILLDEVPYGILKYKVVDKAGNVTEHTIMVGDPDAVVEPMFTAAEIALIGGLALLGLLLILLLLSWNVKVVLYGYTQDGSLKETTQKWLKLRRKNDENELLVKAKNSKNLRLRSVSITLKKGLTKKMYDKDVVLNVEGINTINLTVPEDTDGRYEYTQNQQ